MILASHGIISSQITQFVPLLDDYSGASAAYSLRLLRSGYTGSAIRVRRASDNTEQDIGFVNNELDTSTLTTFCSGTNGFVKTWYDQSGNGYDATQSTAANQPQIVSSGSVILENGKPSVQFDGSDDKLVTASFTLISQPNTIFSISEVNSVTSLGLLYDDDDGNNRNTLDNLGDAFAGIPVLNGLPFVINTQYLHVVLYNGSNSYIYRNNSLLVSGSIGTQGLSGLTIGARFSSNFWNGTIQELIVYNSDESSNRTGIETNINDFYSIY